MSDRFIDDFCKQEAPFYMGKCLSGRYIPSARNNMPADELYRALAADSSRSERCLAVAATFLPQLIRAYGAYLGAGGSPSNLDLFRMENMFLFASMLRRDEEILRSLTEFHATIVALPHCGDISVQIYRFLNTAINHHGG